MGERTTTGLTWEDLQGFPDDGLRRELLDGALQVTPAPSPRHQKVVLALATALREVLLPIGGEVFPAPVDVVLDAANVVEPDVLAFLPASLHRIGAQHARGAPDLVAEVLSPGTATIDHTRKRSLYERFGVAEYWIVDPEAPCIEILTLTDGRYGPPRRFTPGEIVTSTVLPTLAASFDDLVPPA